jgi:sialidase-1
MNEIPRHKGVPAPRRSAVGRRFRGIWLLPWALIGPAAATPLFEQTDVFNSGSDGYFAYRIPAVEAAPDGSLLAFAEARKHHLNDPGFDGQDIDLVLKRSADGGHTWSSMKIIEDPGERWSAANPCTLVDRTTNVVWLFYLRGKPDRNTYTARAGTDDIRILARTSSDHGVTWSEPVDLTAVTREMSDPEWRSSVVGPGGGICTREGTLAIPVWKYKPWGVFAVVSEDRGKTWKRGALVPDVSGDECQLVELSNGRWLIDIRQQEGPHRWRAISEDKGRTWSQPQPGESVSEVCCAIERIAGATGVAKSELLWTGPKGPERSNLVARVSSDDGATFPLERSIAAGFAAYSDFTILNDGTLGVLWERGMRRDYEFLTFTRFNRAWIEAKQAEPAAAPASGMKLLAKEVFMPFDGKRPAATGFVTYVSRSALVLMHCHGWEDFSDGYDDYGVSLSTDNGATWSPHDVRWKSRSVPEGRIRYAEPAAFFDVDTENLIVLTDRLLYPNDKLNPDADYTLVMDVYDPKTGIWAERRELKFPGQRTPAMSFSFPIKTNNGRLLFPGMRPTLDAAGNPLHFGKVWAPVDEMVTVIGEYRGAEIAWRLGQPLNIAPEISSRGLNENALIQLPDNRIAAVCRGDNSAFPDKKGFKWLSFSKDDGETWSPPVPLPATGGDPIESGSNGSSLFRSLKNGRLYWMGNLAADGERAKGNWPRSPLVIVEVQEAPFALKRDTIFTVDERTGGDSRRVQMSNFRFYQDRITGDVVIFLSRYGEQSEKEWMKANYYRYRVRMP